MAMETKPLPVPLQEMSSPCDALNSVMKCLIQVASNPEVQNTATILEEIERQKRQNQIKEEELARAQNDLEVYKSKTEDAIQVNMDIYEKVKREQKNVENERDNLQDLLAEKIKDLEKRAQEIASLQAKVAKLQSDHSQEKAKVAKFCAEITDLQTNVRERDTRIEKMHSAGSNLKTALSDQRKKNEDLKKEMTLLHEKEQKSLNQLRKLEGFAVGYTDVKEAEIEAEFNKLWAYATEQLHAILNQNLENQALNNKLFWKKFREYSQLAIQHRVLLPISNSPAAKAMRLVVILGILARQIDQNIFQPTYLPEQSNLRETLCTLAETDHEKESFCRSLLLSVNKEAQQESLQLRIQAIVHDVSSRLHGVLSEAQYSEIRQRIENVVQRAVKVWRPIQSSEKRYEPDFEAHYWEDYESHLFRFPSDDNEDQDEHVQTIQDNILLTVFPRICLVQDHERNPLTYVTQLIKSQELCVAAEQEMSKVATSPVNSRAPTNGRRSSVAQSKPRSNGGSFLGRS